LIALDVIVATISLDAGVIGHGIYWDTNYAKFSGAAVGDVVFIVNGNLADLVNV
jgi:hypothetical protein